MGAHISIDKIIEESGGHFFDKETTRFFRSTYPRYGWAAGSGVYFVTGERRSAEVPRLYTIRRLRNGGIETVGDFQAYRTRRAANRAVAELLRGEQ